ncbi:MAG: S41 family peptidase [Candidatus Krumholzibacteriales bacterium]
MKKSIIITLAVLIIISGSEWSQAEATADNKPLRLMRRPTISNGNVVFQYQDDLWEVSTEGGVARRLTVHPGREDFPIFSPDGKWIAFRGDYNERKGALCMMPAGGGEPQLLTYHQMGSMPACWTPDSKSVIFTSHRESYVTLFDEFFRIPASGGMPVEMKIGKGSFASFSPDGKKMAFNRHISRYWWWKRYKGSMNHDLWVFDFEEETFEQLTDYDGNDSWPMWTGERIYFVSDRNGDVRNIYYYDLSTEDIVQVTDFTDYGVTWPSMSGDGKKIVFEKDHRLFILHTETEDVSEVVVYAPTDNRINMISYIDPTDYIRSFDISSTGKRLVYQARGDIYTAPAEYGDVRNLTESSGARDRYPTWSPDGKWIAYVSDKSGDDEVYLIDQMGREEEKKLTSDGHFKQDVMWSPDSEKLLYSNEANELYMLEIDDPEPELICRNEHRDITSYHWSPDSRWVAYDFARRNRNRDVYIYDTGKDRTHKVTDNLADDTEPYFTPDGKYLLLITEKYRGINTLARISLLPEEEKPFEKEEDEETGITEDEDEDKDKKDKKKKDKDVEVKIQFEGIEDRMRRVPKTGGRSLHNVQATDRYYYYMIRGSRVFLFRPSYDLYAFDKKEIKSKKIASSISVYAMTRDKKKIGYYDGKFHIIKVGSKAGKKKDDDDKTLVDISNTRMTLDRREEWKQIFNEGWRVVKYHFYDPNLHGVDWDNIRNYYSGLLPYVRTRRELNTLMSEMVGELNASHQGVGRGDSPIEVPRTSMGFMGAKMVLDEKSGYPRFKKIYKSNYLSLSRGRSPLDAPYVKVKEGDYLLAIDGKELEPGENFFKYLVNRTKNKITITTNNRPEMKGSIETRFDPLYHDITLQYKDWVNSNTEAVDEASDGRIGYMHLKDMSGSGWIEFREKFERYRYKDGMIIDVRYNGGGSIDTRVIDYLERRPYHIQRSRGESPIERPHDVFDGEVVVLINEYSFSDAEVFPSAVRERGLGTVIGVPTLGFVIAVTPHYLIDRGYIRKTFIGIWEKSTGKMLESRGAQPDIYVENTPGEEMRGKDKQLDKAIEFLMEKVEKQPRDLDYEVQIEER